MEAQTAQPPTPSASSSSSSAYPRWVMLETYPHCRIHDAAADDPSTKTTMASARTSTGHMIRFSLHIHQAPLATPAVRIIQIHQAPVPGKLEQRYESYDYAVVAAHGDSLLIRVEEKLYPPHGIRTDYFVYNAGDAAAAGQPPSLWLLPPCLLRRRLLYQNLGLLRRRGDGGDDGDGELVVAELRTPRPVPELVRFRSGQWTVKRVPIRYNHTDFNDDNDDGQVFWEHLHSIWSAVVPFGDGRRLCWVHLSRGIMVICDGVFEERPKLRYLKLPVDEPCLSLGLPSNQNRNVCATVTGTLKFVNVFPRCCCGRAGASGCERSRHAYTVHTWTLRIGGNNGGGDMDEMEWVKDGMIDCTELWGLEVYKGLPCVPLDHPVVSLDEDEPHVVYFQLSESHHVKKHVHDGLVWLVKVDVRSKTIRSVSRYEDGFPYIGVIPIPSNVSYFFSSCHPNPSDDDDDDDGTMTAQRRQMDIERQRPVDEKIVGEDKDDDDAGKKPTTLQPASSPSAEPSDDQASEFFDTFLEISRYGFDGDDELKAYRILSHDNRRRFRSLLKLPKDLRKDWLLLEIKQG